MEDKIYLSRQDIKTILRVVADERERVKWLLKTELKKDGTYFSDEELEQLEDKRLRLNQLHFKLREFKRINGI